jgi:hypothetical protein
MIKTSNFKILDMHVPHANNFYEKFEFLNFDIFCNKRLFQIKTAITFAYGLKKRVIYENYLHKRVLLISDPNTKMHASPLMIPLLLFPILLFCEISLW